MYLFHKCPICSKEYERDCTPEPDLPCDQCQCYKAIKLLEHIRQAGDDRDGGFLVNYWYSDYKNAINLAIAALAWRALLILDSEGGIPKKQAGS